MSEWKESAGLIHCVFYCAIKQIRDEGWQGLEVSQDQVQTKEEGEHDCTKEGQSKTGSMYMLSCMTCTTRA